MLVKDCLVSKQALYRVVVIERPRQEVIAKRRI